MAYPWPTPGPGGRVVGRLKAGKWSCQSSVLLRRKSRALCPRQATQGKHAGKLQGLLRDRERSQVPHLDGCPAAAVDPDVKTGRGHGPLPGGIEPIRSGCRQQRFQDAPGNHQLRDDTVPAVCNPQSGQGDHRHGSVAEDQVADHPHRT